MSNQDFGRGDAAGNRSRESLGQSTARAAGDARAAVSDFAGEAATKAKQAVSDTASTMREQAMSLLNGQVGNGADMVGHVAGAVRRAAEELEKEAPQLAGLVSTASDRLNGYAEDLRDQSVEQLVRNASAFTRRQPALVFGLAALAGFLALRTFKSTPSSMSVPSPSIQPTQPRRAGGYNGI
jgi:ElaB/YqjD/DUF883 family membrane-anchored ribosome-binding protein